MNRKQTISLLDHLFGVKKEKKETKQIKQVIKTLSTLK